MERFMRAIVDLEADMESQGAFVFGGALDGADSAAVVGGERGKVVKTDGPFAETKEQIGGFYIISAGTDDEAIEWAARVKDVTGRPIEIRSFRATGKAADHMPGT
jgi:hypothetical protein